MTIKATRSYDEYYCALRMNDKQFIVNHESTPEMATIEQV